MVAKFTFQQYKAEYPDDDACLKAIFNRRYGPEPVCEGCGVVPAKFHKITGRRAYACQDCGHHAYPCAGTIFEHSSTPLSQWFHAMYLMTATRNGVAGKELQRQLGVTYKCAWRIGHQLRLLMAARARAQNPGSLSGHVEVDETYLGGKIKVKRRGKGEYLKNKTTIFGMVQRDGVLRGKVVPNERSVTLLPIIQENIAPGTEISSDMHGAYKRLRKLGYQHGRVNHNVEEWVRGIWSTNTIEGFWSHFKRGVRSTHVSISPQHAQKYVDEFSFRFNHRKEPAEMFNRLVKQVSRVEPSS